MLTPIVSNQSYFAVSVPQIIKNRLNKEKKYNISKPTMWAPHLVVAYLDFAPTMQNM